MNWVHLSFPSSTSGYSFVLSILWVDVMDFVIHSLINLIEIIVIGSTWSRECRMINRMTTSLFILCVQSNREIVTGISVQLFYVNAGDSFSCNSVFSFWLCTRCNTERTLDSCLFNTRFGAKLVTSFSHSISILFAFKVKTRCDTSKEKRRRNKWEIQWWWESYGIFEWFNFLIQSLLLFLSLTEKK